MPTYDYDQQGTHICLQSYPQVLILHKIKQVAEINTILFESLDIVAALSDQTLKFNVHVKGNGDCSTAEWHRSE